MTPNSNPVTRTFTASMGEYQYGNGSTVPTGTDLHQHQDGTIMVGHDPNQMGERVDRTTPATRNVGSNNRQQSSRVMNRQRQNNNPAQRTSTPRQSGVQRNIIQSAARYYYESTGEPYNGSTVMVNGEPHTTMGGAIEGSSERLIRTPMQGTSNTRQRLQQRNTPTTLRTPPTPPTQRTRRTMRNTRSGRNNMGGGTNMGGY
tara:strand:+ start:53 stop:658 length:606 start_codon:yes stop_codon:yes gene_type:complete